MRKVAYCSGWAGGMKNEEFDRFWPLEGTDVSAPSWSASSKDELRLIVDKLKNRK